MIVEIVAGSVVVVGYLIFTSIFGSKKNDSVSSPKVDINDKQSFINRIDYCLENKFYDEALHLCEIYTEYKGDDEDILKRIRYIKKNGPYI